MGLLLKSSITILIIALSTPLLYRQFANDNTIKFMSSYYSNYNSIDQFLRQSATHLDRAKEYVPNSEQLSKAVGQLHQHINTLIASTKSSITSGGDKKPAAAEKPKKPEENAQPSTPKATKQEEAVRKFRLCQCPTEQLGGDVRLWSKQELAAFDGNSGQSDVYLSFLGLVYNVTINMQHYAAGTEYNVFAGRDATRAFLTGNFTHDLHDDIRDLDEDLYSHLDSWNTFYSSNYPVLGRLEGSFYDSNGCSTQELARVYQVFKRLEQDKSELREHEHDIPDCNSEWNSDLKKGRVWCTSKSGGVERNWAGVPRIYNNGEENRCACLNLDAPEAEEYSKFMNVYPGCEPLATECTLTQAN